MHTTPGIYCYTIKQNSGTNERGHYDQTVYYVRVTVTNGGNGDLERVIAAHITGEMTDAKRDILFKNYYEPVESPTESTTETRSTTETKPGNSKHITKTKKRKNKVKTGDNTNVALFTILFMASGIGLFLIAISRHRAKYQK